MPGAVKAILIGIPVAILAIIVFLIYLGSQVSSIVNDPGLTSPSHALVTNAPAIATIETGVPAAWTASMCQGIDVLTELGPAMGDMGDLMVAGDISGSRDAIDRVKPILSRAIAAFDQVPSWGPGDPVVRSLLSSLTLYQQALSKASAGIDAFDADQLTDALSTMQQGTDELTRASDNLTLLQQQYDVAC